MFVLFDSGLEKLEGMGSLLATTPGLFVTIYSAISVPDFGF